MKYLKLAMALSAALFLLSSCSQPEKKDSIGGVTGSATNGIDITGSETDSPVVTEATTNRVLPWNEKPANLDLDKVTTQLSEYNGEDVTITMIITNHEQHNVDQAFVLYVNGQRNDYSTDEYPDKKPYHIYDIPGGDSIEVTLYFTPYNCKKGEKAIVNIGSMLTPTYMPESLSFINFSMFHHAIRGEWPYELVINQDAPESEYNKISTDCIKIELTEEYEKEHGFIYEDIITGEVKNRLDKNNYFDLYQKEDVIEDYYIAENKLTLNLDVSGGSGEKYLVGIYINHELQKAFGDNYYALCDIDRDYLMRFTVNIDVSELSGLNLIYMIAAPYDPADVKNGLYIEKINTSKLVIIGDKDEIEAEIKKSKEELNAQIEAGAWG